MQRAEEARHCQMADRRARQKKRPALAKSLPDFSAATLVRTAIPVQTTLPSTLYLLLGSHSSLLLQVLSCITLPDVINSNR